MSVEFCPLELFQCRAFASTRLNHSYTSLDASKPHKHTYTPMLCSQKPPPVVLRTIQDNNRYQQTPSITNRCPQISEKAEDLWPFRFTSNAVCWCLMVPVSVSCCLEMWGEFCKMNIYWKTLKCKIPHIFQSEYQNRPI